MWPDRVSNPGPLTYKSGALPIALRGPAKRQNKACSCGPFIKGLPVLSNHIFLIH